MKISCSILILAIVFSLPLNSMADDKYVFAKLIEKKDVIYPMRARRMGREGWVYYTYTVGKDGLVHDFTILDSNGFDEINHAVAKSVESGIYEPATLNGTTLEEKSDIGKATFVLSKNTRGASKSFSRSYKSIVEELASGNLDEAFRLLESLRNRKGRSLYEELYLQTQYVSYYSLSGKIEKEYLHILRVLDFFEAKEVDTFLVSPQFFVGYLVKRYEIEVANAMLADAMSTAEWLEWISPDSDAARQIKLHSETIKQKIIGREFGVRGKLVEPIYRNGMATWRARLLRNEIELTKVEGHVDSIQLYCKHGRRKLFHTSGQGWVIPRSWGECTIEIVGVLDTTFVLNELPEGTLAQTGV